MPTPKDAAFDLIEQIAAVYTRYPGAVPGCDPADRLRTVRDGALTLVRAERIMRKWNTLACNGIERYDAKARRVLASWTEADEEAAEKAHEKAKARALAAFAAIFGPRWSETFEAEFQRDPRGAMIKLHEKGRRDSGWMVLSV